MKSWLNFILIRFSTPLLPVSPLFRGDRLDVTNCKISYFSHNCPVFFNIFPFLFL